MLRLRPYKSCDSEIISEWIRDPEVFLKWGGERFGEKDILDRLPFEVETDESFG